MKIHWIKSHPNSTHVGLAQITSENDEILNQNHEDLDHLHPKKRLEYLGSRTLIEQMCQSLNIPFHGIHKDEFGKPHLINSNFHVAISHSYPMIACAIHPISACGIDIESKRPQLLKIKHKFLNPKELERCGEDLEKLCLHWSAKEALYKIHGRKNLIFAEQLEIISIAEKSMEAVLIINGKTEKYILTFEYFSEYLLVYNV